MTEILTFSQCLNKLMQRYNLSSTALASMIGGRSELKKVLLDDGTEAKRNSLYEKLKKSMLFSEEDYFELEHSLLVSRNGIGHYRFHRHVQQLMKISDPPLIADILLENGTSIEERLTTIIDADQIEILCINSCFISLTEILRKLFFSDPTRNVTMWHLFHADAFSQDTSAIIAASFPLLFDSRYHPFGMHRSSDTHVHAIGGNFLVLRAHYPAHSVQLCFAMVSESSAVEMPNASEANPFAFLSKGLLQLQHPPTALKMSPAQNDDLSSLCMNYLSYELNRCTYSITNDLCFHQTPTDIAKAALIDKGSLSEADTEKLLKRTLAIHEQRYQNHYQKQKLSYQAMTLEGCRRFLETGMFTDHFFGFRAFTPEERKRIFSNMLHFAKENRYYVPLLFKDHSFQCKYNLFCYDKLGLTLDKTDTDYDLRKGNRSVFLSFPKFTQQYTQYYQDVLISERCHSPAESLQMLEDLYQEFLEKNSL